MGVKIDGPNLLKKIAALSIADGITKIFGYILLPLYLLLMTKDEYGEFGYLTSAINYASIFLSLSLYVPYIKKYSENIDQKARRELTSTIFSFIAAFLIIIDIILLIQHDQFQILFKEFFEVKEHIPTKYFFIIFLINSSIFGLYFYSLLIGINKVKILNLYVIIKFLLTTIFSIAILHLEFFGLDSVVNRLAGMAIADFFLIIVCIVGLLRNGCTISINFKILREVSVVALPLIPSGIIGLLVGLIDKKLIVEYHGFSEIASYNLALQALAPIQLIMTSIQTIWAPNIFANKSEKSAFSSTKKLMTVLFISMIVISMMIAYLMHQVIGMNVIKGEYSEVPLLIAFLSVGVSLTQLNHLINNMLVKINETKYQLLLSLFLLAISYLSNIMLVPQYSVYGAIISTALSSGIILIFGIAFLEIRLNKIIE